MQNLKKNTQMDLWTHINRLIDTENKLMVTKGKGREG